MNAHDFSFASIEGGEIDLSAYAGKPVLVVNTASECGYTPQYADLQKLWEDYGERGLVVLGVPSNDFGEQEPGDEAEIRSFCTTNYGVEFPMTAKQTVLGGNAHPFYQWVVDSVGEMAAPKWNFHKYLIDANGELAGLWPSDVKPTDPEIAGEVEQHLPR